MDWLGLLLGREVDEEKAGAGAKRLAKALTLVEDDEDRAALAEWLEKKHAAATGKKRKI